MNMIIVVVIVFTFIAGSLVLFIFYAGPVLVRFVYCTAHCTTELREPFFKDTSPTFTEHIHIVVYVRVLVHTVK